MSNSKLAILEVVVAVMEDEIDALTERLDRVEQVLRDNNTEEENNNVHT